MVFVLLNYLPDLVFLTAKPVIFLNRAEVLNAKDKFKYLIFI